MIDWEAARSRLVSLEHALEEPTPERAREVMAARAKILGRAPPAIQLGERVDLVRFACGAEHFALKTQFVRASLHLPKVTPVPFGPAALLGLCAFRGQLLSAWDPAELLTGAASTLAPAWLLVLGRERAELGLAVREVSFAFQTPTADVAPMPEALSRSQLFEGLIAEESIRVLSGQAILAEPRLTWS